MRWLISRLRGEALRIAIDVPYVPKWLSMRVIGWAVGSKPVKVEPGSELWALAQRTTSAGSRPD